MSENTPVDPKLGSPVVDEQGNLLGKVVEVTVVTISIEQPDGVYPIITREHINSIAPDGTVELTQKGVQMMGRPQLAQLMAVSEAFKAYKERQGQQ